jgi:plastocyanin
MFASLSLGLALLPFVVATVHDVQVGGANGLLEYSPEALSAAPGDVVVFHFNPKNHTVSQSAFADPCGLKEGGFHSGFMPVAANSSVDTRPTFSVTVNDTSPVWVYCGQAAGTPASHCGAGMVFAINCPTDSNAANSFTNFKAAALAIGASLSAAASAASATPTDAAATGYGAPAASPTVTAAYGGVTIPPAPSATLVTAAITLDSTSVWTTIYTSFANSPAATPVAAAGAVHTVVVGGSAADGSAELFFSPSSISASPRDQVVFEFHQKNHSVIQSAFTDPCRKLNADNASAPVGFNSGFFAVAANATEFPTWTLTVNDTAPIWAYCGQTAPVSHCGKGMVFAINAVNGSARDFSAFQALAEQLNGTATNASTSGSASPSATNTSGSASPSATDTTGGALSLRVGGASALLTLVAIVASLL